MQGMSVEQTWTADRYARNARFVADLGAGVVEWLDPRPGERILDLGCGDGALTVKLREAGATVVGADASEALVTAARALGLDALVMDGEALTFEREFDAVFSNAALHWMPNAGAVIDGIGRALKPGGRFVAEFGGKGNVAAIVTALLAVGERYGIEPRHAMPWYFPTPDEYAALLEAAGFAVERIALIPRPTPLPGDIRGWLETFREPFFRAAGPDAEAALDAVTRLLAPSLRDQSGRWTADYVRLRVAARLS
jgi:SAM-dependent methyltransferase